MHLFGKVIVIKRNGTDGAPFPLAAKCCVFGRGVDSDIRIQLPTVDTSQCQILIDDKEHVFIQSTSTTSSTLVNDKALTGALTALSHGDVITIVDRKFRFEFPVDSRFYPRKSPKPKSPRTPKRVSMTELSASGEKDSGSSQHLIPVTPLSPRTDNVPASIKSPRSASKVLSQPVPGANVDQFSSPQTGRQLYGSAKKASSPEMLFSLPPNAFYRTITPGSSKGISDPQEGLDVSPNIPPGGQVNRAFQKSPIAVRQKSPGSPYSKTPGNLRKSISDLRRRSVPVFETEEGSAKVQKRNQQQEFATPSVQLGTKRKSTAFDLLSAKRKRVSFGPNLSPEHFDKTLPPKTPIKKGATPSRIPKQERKSLLKAKSPGRKSMSPRAKSPAKVASTPPSSQVFEVSVNAETFSPTVTSVDGAKLQSPKYGSVFQRSSPRAESENETLSLGSPGRKLSPANKRNSPASVKLSENDASIIEYSDQEMLLSNALTKSASALAVLSPNTKSFGKDVSPLSTGNSSFASSPQMTTTPRSFLVSSTEKKRSVGRPRSRSSPSLQSSPTSGRSDSSFRKSATPRSFSVSSAEKKRSVGRPRSRSGPSLQSSPTSRSSDSSFQMSTTPRSFMVMSAEKKRSVGRPRSKSIQSPATSSRSDSSFRKSVTPRKSHSPLETSISVIASLSPKNTLLNASDSEVLPTPVNRKYAKTPVTAETSFIEIGDISAKSRKLTTTLSPNLFSQVSPNAVPEIVALSQGHTSPKFKGTKLHNTGVASPVGLTRIFRTPKHRQTANISPSAIKRLMKTPKVKHIQISPISPIGLRNLVKTPRNRKSNQVVDTPSGLIRVLKTPHVVQGSEALSSVKEKKKSPRSESADVSYSGVSTLLSTPDNSAQAAPSLSLDSGRTFVQKSAIGNTPRRYSQTPKKFLETPVTVLSTEKKRPVGRPPSAKKQPTDRPSSVERPVGHSPSGKSPVGRPPSEKRPVGQPASEKRPVGRPPSGKKEPLEKSSSVGRPFGESPSVKSPVGRSPSVKSPVGRPPSVKSPVGQPPLEKSPVGRPTSEKSPVGRPPSEKSPVGRPPLEKSPVGRPPSEKSPVERPTSEKSPVGRPTSEKSPIGRPPSVKSPVGQLASEKRPVGRPPSEKRPVGRPPSEKRPVGRPPSGKKTPATKNSPTEKIISPPQDFKKVVALRAIHGHALTPKRAAFKVLTPKSIKSKASSLFRKTPGKKTWSDIVKSGVQKPAIAKKIDLTTIKAVAKRISPKLNKKVHKTPKTPRALARALAPTTGHADSPATIIVGRKFKGTRTPKLLPRKGRKESLSKASRKSMGNMSFTGLAEMFTEPVVSESSLYADIPDTPDGPNEMFVSPLSSRKSSLSARKSTNLTGVRELFMKKHVQETNLIGVKELFTSSGAASTVSPSGLKRLMKTPKKRASGVSPTGVKRLLTTPKIKGVPVSPSGLDSLFKTPTYSGDAMPYDGEPALNQAASSGKTAPLAVSTKSGQRGRKRKSESPYATTPSKKLTPAHLTADLSPRISRKDHREQSTENKVASARKPSPGKSPTPSGKRQSEVPKAQAALENRGSPATVSSVETAAVVNKSVDQSEKQTLSPKLSVRGRHGKAAVKTFTLVGEIHIQSPQVGGSGRRDEAEIRESEVNIKRVELNVGDKYILSPPKVGPRGRRGKATVKETSAPVQSPPKVGVRGRRGLAQIKESIVNVKMVKGDDENILSPPKVGPRGRQRKAQITETVSLSVDTQSPPKVGARGRRGQAGIKESGVNIETVDVDDKHILSPPKVGPRGRQRKVQITETVSLAADVQSPPKVGARGRRGKVQIKESTEIGTGTILALNEDSTSSSTRCSGHRQGRKPSKETLQAQENATPDVELAEPLSKGKRGRGQQAKEPVQVQSVSSLNVDGDTAGSKVRQRRTAVIKSVPGKDASVAVIENPLSVAARGGRGRSKIESASAEDASTVTLDVMATSSSKTVARGRRVVPQVTKIAATNSPKRRVGRRRNETSPATESVLPDKSSARGTGPSSPVSNSAGTQAKKQIGGMKRKAGTSTSVPAKKVKLDSPVPVSPVKPRATRRGKNAETKSPNINILSFPNGRGRPKKGAAVKDVASPLINAVSVIPAASPKGRKGQLKAAAAVSSPKGRGRPQKAADVTEVAPVQINTVSVIPESGPKGRKGQLKAAAAVSSPKGRGRPQKAAEVAPVQINTVSVITESAPKGRKGQLKKAETVQTVASPSPGKRGRPKKDVSVQGGTILIPKSSSSKGRQGKLKKVETTVSPALKNRGGPKASLLVPNISKRNSKSAGAISDAVAVLPKSTVATRRRRL